MNSVGKDQRYVRLQDCLLKQWHTRNKRCLLMEAPVGPGRRGVFPWNHYTELWTERKRFLTYRKYGCGVGLQLVQPEVCHQRYCAARWTTTPVLPMNLRSAPVMIWNPGPNHSHCPGPTTEVSLELGFRGDLLVTILGSLVHATTWHSPCKK